MPEADIETVLAEAFRRINELGRRLRTIEERWDLLENRLVGLQESMISNSNADKERSEKMATKLKSLEEHLLSIGNDVARLSKLVEKGAKKSEVDELKQLMELYSPFKRK